MSKAPVLILLFMVMGACSKVSGPAVSNSAQPDNRLDTSVGISATINGSLLQTDSVFGYRVVSSGNDSGYTNLMITATKTVNDTPRTFTFNLTNYNGAATYPVNPPINSAVYFYGSARHYGTSGQIVVTSVTAYAIIGTFQFVADSLKITGGTFNITMP